MDEALHREFEDLTFPNDITDLYAKIIVADPWLGNVLFFIARRLELNKQAGIEMYGVTVTDIVDNLSVTRPVQHKGENNQLEYKKEKTNIDRKHAERIITNLRNMSLCFYSRPAGRTNFYFVTVRGLQVLERATQLIKNNEKISEE
ncbi:MULTISPECIES: hypothetical protein [Bacillus cereus group]|uniref:Uncharacterized protein n=2 Tax=Bacillus cereus group TaxID=86661 RepID=A0A9W7UNS0_BACCE|nr:MULTISPECIES: hypothetical protein [Bacillus cereus group]ALL11680.1 hypothetical protein BTXL6_27815 [Bacillus thuringiensis]EEM19123.1 hypothetical protein bthur0001_57620 [Bacillus thuringiensis serovar tochigiensis BGSC 4Y1]ALL21819.1 hypothetical protein BTXL6_10250 [Bacillus thuringiensis]EEM56660.1 hypothetical protein bthur0007_54350 [Bacillus thuringiensis serovar monterrey BGSC 4AJ1]EJR72658.1 hypothetical protein IK9_05433 [Bacillus cereus VD166]